MLLDGGMTEQDVCLSILFRVRVDRLGKSMRVPVSSLVFVILIGCSTIIIMSAYMFRY